MRIHSEKQVTDDIWERYLIVLSESELKMLVIAERFKSRHRGRSSFSRMHAALHEPGNVGPFHLKHKLHKFIKSTKVI